jgi:hypothetical protein
MVVLAYAVLRIYSVIKRTGMSLNRLGVALFVIAIFIVKSALGVY